MAAEPEVLGATRKVAALVAAEQGRWKQLEVPGQLLLDLQADPQMAAWVEWVRDRVAEPEEAETSIKAEVAEAQEALQPQVPQNIPWLLKIIISLNL